MIPKIFHHTWPSGGALKPRFETYRQAFIKMHPDYEFKVWTCENREEYAISEISKYIQSPLCKLHWIVISDIMRYEILYKYGGIYLDTDTEPLKNHDCFLDCDSFAGVSYSPNTIGNGTVGTVPGNPLFKKIAVDFIEMFLDLGRNACQEHPDSTIGVNFAGEYLKGLEKLYPRNYFYPFRWDEIKKNLLEDYLTPEQRIEAGIKKFPESYSIHWWSGMDKDGWTTQRYIPSKKKPEAVFFPEKKPEAVFFPEKKPVGAINGVYTLVCKDFPIPEKAAECIQRNRILCASKNIPFDVIKYDLPPGTGYDSSVQYMSDKLRFERAAINARIIYVDYDCLLIDFPVLNPAIPAFGFGDSYGDFDSYIFYNGDTTELFKEYLKYHAALSVQSKLSYWITMRPFFGGRIKSFPNSSYKHYAIHSWKDWKQV